MAQEQLRQFLRAEVAMAVGPLVAPSLRWSTTQLPTLQFVDALRDLPQVPSGSAAHLFSNDSDPTAFEVSDGNWEGVAAGLCASGASTLTSLSSAFTTHVLPSSAHADTRRKHWRCWRGILTWAVARRCLPRVLPMSQKVLHAFLMELLCLDCSHSTIKGFLDCIQSRHRMFNKPSPLVGQSSYQRLCRSLRRFQGRQAPYKYPIHRSLVAQVLSFRAPTISCRRDCLAAALATICCLRPMEGARLQSCDIFFDFDMACGSPDYEGTAAVNVMSRKNDQARKGHHPRIGRSNSDALDLVHQLRIFMTQADIAPRAGCRKRQRPHARCPVCPPLFPLSSRGAHRETLMSHRPPSPAAFSQMIVRALGYIGCDTSAFSGVCARRGGLSTAVEAGVPEPILWLQSGHAQTRAAARVYIRLQNPSLLFATWRAFSL